MDLNHQYAAHQRAMMRAAGSSTCASRSSELRLASSIAADIGSYQEKLGAAAACAWSHASVRGSPDECGA